MNDRLQFAENEHGDPGLVVIHGGLSPQATKLLQYSLPHIEECIYTVCDWFEIEHGDLDALDAVFHGGRKWFSDNRDDAERKEVCCDNPFSMSLECSVVCLSAFLDTLEPPAQMAEAALNLAKSVECLSAFKTAAVFAVSMPPEEAAACMAEALLDDPRTRRDNLHVAASHAIAEYQKRHKQMPTARAVFDLLAREANEAGPIIRYVEKDDVLEWRRQDGGISETGFKAFQNRWPRLKSRI